MTAYVLVVRHPDYANEIVADEEVEVIDIDLGSSFDETPDSEAEAVRWLGSNGPTYLNKVPADSPVYRAAMETLNGAVGKYEAAVEILRAYDGARRGT